MTSTPRPVFDVTLKHLAPDGSQAGIDFRETSRPGLSVRELRALLRAIVKLAPAVEYPAEPTVRIEAPAGRFLISIKAHQLQFTSWSSSQAHPVCPPVDEMLRIFAGDAVEGELDVEEPAAPGAPAPKKPAHKLWLVFFGLVIVGANVYTIMDFRKPPGNFLPPYKLVTGPAAAQALESVAGRYETGRQAGDRRLVITTDGQAEWSKYGKDGAVVQPQAFTVQAAEAGGPALLTSRQTLITIKDPATLIYFKDVYTRVR